jgi:hypothetical protein
MQTTKMLSTKAFELWMKEQAQTIVRYRQVEKSELLAEYNQLKEVVESSDFQAKKNELITTKYADTQEAKTIASYKLLRKKSSVFFYRLFKKAAWKEKEDVAQYLALKEQISTPEFKQTNAFWKNKKRWLTTPEFLQEKRYNALAKHADIVFFGQHTEQEVAELESYKMVWADEMDGVKMQEVWQTGFLYPSKNLKANHSHVSEKQAYTEGKNTKMAGSVLSIKTKKQKTTAPAWHPTKGMLMHPFKFTSDIWHTAEAVAPEAGVLQAKVSCAGKAKHMLCLTTATAKKALPILSEKTMKGYIVYTVVWNKKEVINYVNNVEVAREKNTLAGEKLHLLVRSYLPENKKARNGQLNIDWIRIYTNA